MKSIKEYKDWIEEVNEIPSIVIRRNEKIDKPVKTARSIIKFLEANPGNRGYKPYWNTLVEIKKELENKNNHTKVE